MENLKILRAEETWQKAGAYFVRIQGMNRQYHISLKEEFDEFDEKSKYIVLLDNEYPIGTCRFYEINSDSVILGRVVVLPEYRKHHIGKEVIDEAVKWIKELGYKNIRIDARVEAVGFYEKLGFTAVDDEVIKSWNFDCRKMIKVLD